MLTEQRFVHRRHSARQRINRSALLMFASLCLLVGGLLNLPYMAPGYQYVRLCLVLSLGFVGVAATLPAVWHLRLRIMRSRVQGLAGMLLAAVWAALLGQAFVYMVLLTSPIPLVGFGTRELNYVVRSQNGRIIYYGYRWNTFGKPGAGELTLRRGPYEVVVLEDDEAKRSINLMAWGHHLEKHSNDDGSENFWIDGVPASVDTFKSW